MLWEKLYVALTTNVNNYKIVNYPLELINNSRYLKDTIRINEEKTGSKFSWSLTNSIPRPLSEPAVHSSAFKPYTTKQETNSPINRTSINKSELNLLSTYTYQTNFNHAAHMETIVSNLGKSNQGHLCIYCGKCYSRKYGLKIHIRTHTGYKPLKCKYCLRPFGDPSNLNKHVRLHAEGDTPYK